MFTIWANDGSYGHIWVTLKKDGHDVAWHVDDDDLATDNAWNNISVSIRHREKLD
jgi:hypothetical protein